MSYALAGVTFLSRCFADVLLVCQFAIPSLFSGGPAGLPFIAISLILA